MFIEVLTADLKPKRILVNSDTIIRVDDCTSDLTSVRLTIEGNISIYVKDTFDSLRNKLGVGKLVAGAETIARI